MTIADASDSIAERHESARERALDGRSFAAWVDGEPYETDEVTETRDPVVDEPITTVPVCDVDDVDAAVAGPVTLGRAVSATRRSCWSTPTTLDWIR